METKRTLESAVKEAKKKWTRGYPSQKLISELARDFALEYLVAEDEFFNSIAEYPEPEEADQ
jgi:hypothetical protein